VVSPANDFAIEHSNELVADIPPNIIRRCFELQQSAVEPQAQERCNATKAHQDPNTLKDKRIPNHQIRPRSAGYSSPIPPLLHMQGFASDD
jgi:hypothetical protein